MPFTGEPFDQAKAAVLRETHPAARRKGVHPDDIAVDRFAAEMKDKLAAARAKGRGGWDSPECTQERLSTMLREHVEKGDPRDVANFCMFLFLRGESIAPTTLRVPAPGMAVTALAREILDALLADEKDGGYDLTAGLFGPAFSKLVRRWAEAEWSHRAKTTEG